MADKVNILLVDQRSDDLQALETILNPLDQNLVTATSSNEALKILLNHEFAVILLDLEIPNTDGVQAAALIRRQEKTRHTPIVFLGSDGKNEAQLSIEYSLGHVDHIIRPFLPEVLRSKVAAYIDMLKNTKRSSVSRRSLGSSGISPMRSWTRSRGSFSCWMTAAGSSE